MGIGVMLRSIMTCRLVLHGGVRARAFQNSRETLPVQWWPVAVDYDSKKLFEDSYTPAQCQPSFKVGLT